MNLRKLINQHFDTLETIFLLVFATGMVFLVKEMPYAKTIIIAGTAGFIIIYWFKSTERKENETVKQAIPRKLVWYSMMIFPIATYSKLNIYPNSDKFLIFAIVIAFIITYYQNNTENQKNYKFSKLRINTTK